MRIFSFRSNINRGEPVRACVRAGVRACGRRESLRRAGRAREDQLPRPAAGSAAGASGKQPISPCNSGSGELVRGCIPAASGRGENEGGGPSSVQVSYAGVGSLRFTGAGSLSRSGRNRRFRLGRGVAGGGRPSVGKKVIGLGRWVPFIEVDHLALATARAVSPNAVRVLGGPLSIDS